MKPIKINNSVANSVDFICDNIKLFDLMICLKFYFYISVVNSVFSVLMFLFTFHSVQFSSAVKSDSLQPYECSLLLLPPIPPSIRVFSSESTLRMRWPKYWSFSFGISPSKDHPGLISFRMDWLDLLAVQGTLKSLLQHHSSKASVLRCSAFFTVQLTSIHDHWKNHKPWLDGPLLTK